MDVNALNQVIKKETEHLQVLLELLEEQHELLIGNDIYSLEEMVERIQKGNKAVAELEVQRRKLVGNDSMKQLVEESSHEELSDSYRSIVKLLNEVKTQKEANDMLIKMGLGYSARMLKILSPVDKNNTVYNARGSYKK